MQTKPLTLEERIEENSQIFEALEFYAHTESFENPKEWAKEEIQKIINLSRSELKEKIEGMKLFKEDFDFDKVNAEAIIRANERNKTIYDILALLTEEDKERKV